MKLKVKFADDSGAAVTVVFDNANGTLEDDRGHKGEFSFDPATNTQVIKAGDFNDTVTYVTPPVPQVGSTTRYVTSTGQKGVATLLAME
jgi:hypothetical protein